jgi:hypothetical protein
MNTGAVQQRIDTYNTWLRQYASEQGIPLIDFYSSLIDPATGAYVAALTIDGTHQSEAGAKVLGQLIADTAFAQLPSWGAPLPVFDTTDSRNLLLNGLFRAGTPTATSWLNTGGTPSIATAPPAAGNPAVAGSWQRLTDVAVETANIRQNISTGFSPGDVIECTGRVTSVKGNGTATWSLLIQNTNGSPVAMYIASAWTADIVDGIFYFRWIVPPSTTALQFQLARVCSVVGTVPGYSEIAQVSFKNLTTLGTLAA